MSCAERGCRCRGHSMIPEQCRRAMNGVCWRFMYGFTFPVLISSQSLTVSYAEMKSFPVRYSPLSYRLVPGVPPLRNMQLPTNFALNVIPFMVVTLPQAFTYSTTCSHAAFPSKCLKFSLIFMIIARKGDVLQM